MWFSVTSQCPRLTKEQAEIGLAHTPWTIHNAFSSGKRILHYTLTIMHPHHLENLASVQRVTGVSFAISRLV